MARSPKKTRGPVNKAVHIGGQEMSFLGGGGSRTEKDRKAQTQDGPGLWLKRHNPDKDSGLRQLLVQKQTWVLNVGTRTPAHLGPS